MRTDQKSFIVAGILFFLFLVSYKFSLYQNTSLLPYLNDAASATTFQRIITYTCMMFGLPPTMFLILYTTYLCQTSYPNNIVHITCFGNPFSLSGPEGFFAYIVSSLLSVIILWYLYSLVRGHNGSTRHHK